MLTDRELIKEAKSGSSEAFGQLVKRYYQKAYSIAYWKTGNSEAALDISQEAFIRVYRKLKSFDTTKSFLPWLHTIIKNLCLNYLKRRKRRWLVFSDFFAGKPTSEQEISREETGEFEKNESKTRVWEALNRLKEEDREIIVMKDLHGMSYKEIAGVLNIPPGTVMSRLYHARKKLLSLFEVEDE